MPWTTGAEDKPGPVEEDDKAGAEEVDPYDDEPDPEVAEPDVPSTS